MGAVWNWPFGPETAVGLQDAGWSFTSTSSSIFAPTSSDPYTYTGAPTKYSMGMSSSGTNLMTCPSACYAPGTTKGAVAAPIRNPVSAWVPSETLIRLRAVTRGTDIRVQTVGGTGSLALYVDNVLKETTSSFDWFDWHYISLKWNMSASPWSAQLFVDGVAATSLQTEAAAVETQPPSVAFGGASAVAPLTQIGQVITYDDTADTSEVARFATRIEATTDGTNVGTWAPSLGGTDFAELNSPLDSATYTEEASPNVNDRVEITTGATTIDTLLGTTTTTIDALCVHAIASGQNITGRAVVGDGVSESNGDTFSIGATPSYDVVNSLLTPGGGVKWDGADTPEFIFEVVSI